MTATSGNFRCCRRRHFALHAVEIALVALVAKRVVRVPLANPLVAEQLAAVFAMLTHLASDGTGTAESDANRHIVTLCSGLVRSGQIWRVLRTLALDCTRLHNPYPTAGSAELGRISHGASHGDRSAVADFARLRGQI